MSEIVLTKDNFDVEVMKSELPVFIDFWASWCGPCKMLAPHISELANEYKGKLKVCKVNVDDEPELAATFKIVSIPTIVIMKDGNITNSSVGYMSKSELENLIK